MGCNSIYKLLNNLLTNNLSRLEKNRFDLSNIKKI